MYASPKLSGEEDLLGIVAFQSSRTTGSRFFLDLLHRGYHNASLLQPPSGRRLADRQPMRSLHNPPIHLTLNKKHVCVHRGCISYVS